ncbi:MAG: hypothetical protein ACR2GO_00650 [Candidatus Limnocylindria bacterium]
MATEPLAKPEPKTRGQSATKFAVYSLGDALAAAKAIHEQGGGRANNEQLAAYLRYKSAKNGAYLELVASARAYGLVQSEGGQMVLTERAQSILMPVYRETARQAMVDAFLAVPLFKAVYEDHRGRHLPPEFGLKNLMRTHYGIVPGRIHKAYRALMESAEQAAFFEVTGSRTQLIIPNIGAPRSSPPAESENDAVPPKENAGGGGDDGDNGSRPPVTPKTTEELKNEYISTLIGALRDQGSKGEVDNALMTRIEKLLGLPQ